MVRYMNKYKKWHSLVMALIMLFTFVAPSMVKADATSVPLVAWDGTGPNDNFTVTGGLEVNSDKKLTVLGATIKASAAGPHGASVATAENWNKENANWHVSVNTEGYADIKVSSNQISSNTGPKEFKFQYSLNDVNWIDVPGGNVISGGTWPGGKLSNIELPDDARDKSIVYLRWLVVGNTSLSGGEIASGGTSRIADIVITGVPIQGSIDPGNATEKPDASKISFSEDYVTVTGATYAVQSNDFVKVYDLNQQLMGATTANDDGSFELQLTNPAQLTNIFVTATEEGKDESGKVSVSIPKTTSPLAGKMSFFDSTAQLTGLQGGASAQSLIQVYFDVNTATSAASTLTNDDGSFSIVTIPNAVGKQEIWVSAKENGKLESDRIRVVSSDSISSYRPGDVVFSQVYVNGGNSGAFYNSKFFELYNNTDRDIVLDGWSISYTSAATMSFTTSGNNFNALSGTIKAHGYYLIAANKGATGADLPVKPDLVTQLNPSGSTGGAIGLMQTTKGITGVDDPNLIDVIAYTNASSTTFKNPLYFGQPFVASNVGNGTILRKTDTGSDPRGAWGSGNGWFTKNTASDFVVNAPSNPNQPVEVVLRNSKSMISPDASKISFTQSGNQATVIGTAGAVPSAATVKAYLADQLGVLQGVSGSAATANADGSFTLSFTILNDNLSVFLTHTDNSQPVITESKYARVNKDGQVAGTAPIHELRMNDAVGFPANIGYSVTVEGVATTENQALGAEKTHFFLQDGTGGIQVVGASDPIQFLKGDSLEITGRVAFHSGMTVIIPSSITNKGQATSSLSASSIQLSDLGDYKTAEALEGSLASLSGKVTNIAAAGVDYNVTVTDEKGNTAIVRMLDATGIKDAVQLQESYSFTGIIGQSKTTSPYTSNYYLMPRTVADIKGELSINHLPLNKAFIGINTRISAVVKYADSVTLYYKSSQDSVYKELQMMADSSLLYEASIPHGDVDGSEAMNYYIVAMSGGTKKSVGSETDPINVPIIAKDTGPEFYNESPEQGAKVESKKPTISVDMYDPLGVNISSVTMKVDETSYTGDPNLEVKDTGIKLKMNDDLSEGTHTVTVSATDLDGRPSTHTWTFEVVPRFVGGNHYLGTTHNHTNISHDASGDPEAALIASKAHGYDWFAFSDHSHDIDSNLVGSDSVESSGGYKERKGGSDWQLTKDLAKQYTKNGQFVVFPGFEMTSTTWGHSNVFGTENFIDRKEEGGIYQNLRDYYNWVLTHDEAVAQFNHPDMSKNAFDNFVPYDKQVDQLFKMIEVGNGSGKYSYVNSERKFFSALDLGWHVAPTYGEDNHDATWGQTDRRTVIVASDLSYESLFDAMRKMHVYMTEDKGFTFDVLASDFYMGSTTDTKTLNFTIKGTSKVNNIKSVDIVSDGGRVIDTKDFSKMNTKNLQWNPDPIISVGSNQWYVVRVTLEGGARAYSSPIWTPEEAISVKVSNIEAADGAVIADLPAKLNVGIANLGIQEVTNLTAKLYFDTVDGNHLIGQASLASLQAGTTGNVAVTWQKPVAGERTIIVKLTADQELGDNGYEQSFKVKAPLGKKILIDASHQNENTTTDVGSYKDSMKDFTTMMKQQGYKVEESKATLTSVALQDVDVLVVTHPATEYSSAEINLIKQFVQVDGKSLLLTGKSNFKANQNPNSLLKGIGSSILINNDGVFDESAKGNFWSGNKVTNNFAVRPHPTPMDNYLTDFVTTLDYYSGSSLARNNNGAKAKLVDDENVTIIVRGNETSFQSNVLGDGAIYSVNTSPVANPEAVTGGSQIPLAAVENVGLGRVFVTGMNVFNDKQTDQSFEPKGNVPLAHHIVDWLAHLDTKVTKLGQVHQDQLPQDTEVVVQGTVTSASGVFFDAFYLQDETGGIMAFNEVPDGLKAGDIVRIHGHISIYENNLEVEISEPGEGVIYIGQEMPVEPKVVSTANANLPSYQGQLVKVTGKITDNSKSGEASPSYVINDGSGPLLIFIDGYIINQSGPIPQLEIGETLEVTGFTAGAASGPQIRVGDTTLMRKVSVSNDDATLSSIRINGTPLSGFSSGKLDYEVKLPADTTEVPNITVSTTNPKASYEITNATSLPGTSSIQVTSEDGSKTQTYSIKFTVLSSNPGSPSNPDVGSTSPSTPDKGETRPPVEEAKPGLVILTPDQLKGGNNGNVSIQLPEDTREVVFPSNTKELLGNNMIELKSDTVNLMIPSELFGQLASRVSADQLQQSSISLKFSPLSETEARSLINRSQNTTQATINYDKLFVFNLTITTADGRTFDLKQFDQPMTLQLKVGSGIHPNLAAIFYIQDNGALEYIGGQYSNGYITAQINHFSKYAVLEVTKDFVDVPSGHWAAGVIQELVARQIVNGISETHFDPAREVTRAEFTAMLVRALNLTTAGDNPFKDVSAASWYAQPISIAYEAGVVKGKNATMFDPNGRITREEMVVMVMQAYAIEHENKQGNYPDAPFKDMNSVSKWAVHEVNAAASLQMINGRELGKFVPRGTSTRAEAVQIICNLLTK